MPLSGAVTLIRQWGERFRKDALAADLVAGLGDRGDEIWRRAFELLQRESPEYRNAVDHEFASESKAHCNELLKTIVAVAARRTDKSRDPFDFVRRHAAWRARHRVPLIASLHAYRLAHRIYGGMTREALLPHARQKEAMVALAMLSDFWIEFFDHVGAVLADAHAVEEGLIVAQSTEAYGTLVEDLLRGIPPRDTDAQRLCALCGIRPGAKMAVAIARPIPSAEDKAVDRDVTLRSVLRAIEQALAPPGFGKLVGIRNDEVTAIACSDRDPARGLFQALRRNGFARRAASGVGARIGISLDASEIGRLPQALDEARLALDFAGAGRPLMPFADIDLPEFLLRRADGVAFRLVPEWARHLGGGRDDPSRSLARTIRTFADCNFNVKQTAHRLGIHTNTVYFRLNRINKLTGIDPRTYSGTSLILTALRLTELHGNSARYRNLTLDAAV
jgi:hypothetical protein